MNNLPPPLARLSWEHHGALTVASRILQGLERGADPAEVAAYTRHIWQRWMLNHNRMEERLLEACVGATAIDPRMTRRLFSEHQEMELLGARLADRSDRLPAILGEFAGTLRNHIRFEEQELFPAMRAHLPPTATTEEGDHEAPEIDWAVPFWE